MADVLHVGKADFAAQVVEAELPVLVDFWAEWCGPCRIIAPLVEKLAEHYAGRLRVAKVDVTADQELAVEHQVMSIPTLLLFRGGKAGLRLVGASYTLNEMQKQIDEALAAET